MEQQNTMHLSYNGILEKLRAEISKRKSNVFERTLLIMLPLLVLLSAGYYFNEIYDYESLSSQRQFFWGIIAGALFLSCSIYIIIVNFIFQIEKHIWIHSYFDEKNLTINESWSIARKISLSALKFRFVIFLKYYLIPFSVFIGIIIFLVLHLNQNFNKEMDIAWIIFLSLIGLILFLPFYYFYNQHLKFKLRYSWFLFLDNHGKENDINLLSEMHTMNKISKSETFKKQMSLNIGTDSVEDLNKLILEMFDLKTSQPENIRGLNNGLNNIYKSETSNQLVSLGDIITQHILYNFIQKEFLDKENKTNEHLYQI